MHRLNRLCHRHATILRVTKGYGTPEGTARLASRFPATAGFYRAFDALQMSSLGLGTYLGDADDHTDRAYEASVSAAVQGGLNFLDTAINYRNQRSERSIGVALAALFGSGAVQRDELVVCTKAGFLTKGAVPSSLKPEDVVGGMHSMQPDFLSDQIERSRANLGLETLDVFYLHNPETQLGYIGREEFDTRIRRAFRGLEGIVSSGKIRYYGTATWNGYRQLPGSAESLNLSRLLEIATEEAGAGHHFRFIQLPFNIGMVEAFVQRNGSEGSVLESAERAGVAVVASASLLQARLSRNLPAELTAKVTGLKTDAQRAIQFTRSTPGIIVALVGMSNAAHVAENLGISAVSPITPEMYAGMYQRS
jgi:aryl-alcohol dehydrogenase-like predicted oxidoreductase